ncbi:hypothetical protein SAMN06265337_1914 [Hymenobacter gelipurpurascens]|uniref:Uncharacterized protein n=1 Tax=Hymenobacter gelipurpurascens TaxID=89968 RepID=A0A212TNC3_9BACT|nr:hypothetical protein SAMN06265337_1914 [Hymenobacter gelipurpurascens]
MPHLLAAASAINVAAGGRPLVGKTFTPFKHMALGGVTSALVRESVSGGAASFDYEAMGAATASALRKTPVVARISDVKEGLSRSEFTDSMANS